METPINSRRANDLRRPHHRRRRLILSASGRAVEAARPAGGKRALTFIAVWEVECEMHAWLRGNEKADDDSSPGPHG